MGYVIYTLVNQRWNTLIRLLSIGLGLAMGIFLLVKVARDTSFDSCFKDSNRLAQVWEKSTVGEEVYVSEMGFGPKASALAEELPDVIESATIVAFRPTLRREDGVEFDVPGVCSDSAFFKTMGVEVIYGNPEIDLVQPYTLYLSDNMATEMYGSPEEAIGKMVRASYFDDMKVVGIFRDYGEETTVKARFVFGQPTYTAAYGEENGMSWRGGTWWNTYIRLRPGVKPESLDRRIEAVIKHYLPDTDTGTHSAYARPIRDTYRNYESVKRMNRVLGWLGILILVITALNYVLLSVSALHRRSKAIGVFKCCGARKRNIFGMFMMETAILLVGAIVITAFFWWLTKTFAAETVYASITSAVSLSRLWVVLAVTVAVFAVAGILPALVYSHVSPTHLFQKKLGGNGMWKQGLLIAESCGAALACSLLALVLCQYHTLTDASLGFNPDRLVMINGHPAKQREVFKKAYESLPYVDSITVGANFPGWGYSGDRIRRDVESESFIAKIDEWEDGYAGMMGIKILHGRQPQGDGEIAVNRTFTTHFTNNPEEMLGEYVNGGWMSEPQKVVGVVDDFRFQSFYQDVQPLAIYPLTDSSWRATLIMRLAPPFESNLDRLANEIAERYPGEKITLRNMSHELRSAYKDVSLFALLTGIASAIIVLITLTGLIGVVTDDMERRRKEIAVRRINGASIGDIIAMFAGRISILCSVGIIAGAVIAWTFSREWLSQFKLTVGHPGHIIFATAVALAVLIGIIATLSTRRIALTNPSQSLRSE